MRVTFVAQRQVYMSSILDVSYLVQLTCYAEFNRMVNAIAKHGTTAG